jgi:hypothetical protein
MSDDLYPAPSDARRKRRRASDHGTGFYIARDRPFVGMNEYRDRRRQPDARVAVKLANQLAKLAGEFPRFRLSLNRLQHHVLMQVRSASWKARTVLKCLHQHDATSTREIIRCSGLDFNSVSTTLAELHASDRIRPCNRAGRPLAGDQDRRNYWLRN